MSTLASKPQPEFIRRSDTESICMWCFMTLRVKQPEHLKQDELLHASLCIQRPDGPIRRK